VQCSVDPSLTAARVIPILMELEKWNSTGCFTCGVFTLVPGRRADIIRRQHPSTNDQKKEAATYYVTCLPFASWGDLASRVYRAGEKRAGEVFKAQLPKPKGNQCDCVECVGAVCSDSVHSALWEVLLSHEALYGTRTIAANFPLSFNSIAPSALVCQHN